MKLRTFAMMVGMSSVLVLSAACSDETTGGSGTAGSAGDGGSGNTGNEGGSGVGATGGTGNAGGTGTTGGAGGGTGGGSDCGVDGPNACNSCAEVITFGCAPGDLCEGGSSDLYDTLVQCVCVDSCMTECGDFCGGGAQSAECTTCITTNCQDDVNNCGNDAG
jgi:hypothetical protein